MMPQGRPTPLRPVAAATDRDEAGPLPGATGPAEEAPASPLEILLRIEALARRAETVAELAFLIANETGRLVGARQIIVFRWRPSDKPEIAAVSGVSRFDRHGPLLEGVTGLVAKRATRERQVVSPMELASADPAAYPFPHLLWVPLTARRGAVFAGLLLARETPWLEQDFPILDRLAGTYAHAWLALEPRSVRPARLAGKIRPLAALGVAALSVALAWPVHMSVLAPVEIGAASGRVVTSPLDGVVDAILVDANTKVRAGTPLVRLADTALRNEAAIAAGELDTIRARLRRILQLAASDPQARREIPIARADLEVAEARLAYASEQLALTVVPAPADGVTVYTDRRDFSGRPVRTGERIMEIADPARLDLRIHVPLQDAIVVAEGMRVRAFLDSDPLDVREATVINASYEARPREDGSLAYEVRARFDGPVPASVRLGGRGTAQVLGEKVPLVYYLFRKPLTSARQWLGL